MRDALIDLGEVPSGGAGEPGTALPRPPWPYRWILGLLTAVLVVLPGGGGPPPPPPPVPVVLPIAPGDRIQADGDRLFVIGQPEPYTLSQTYLIQAYDLPGVTPAASYRVTVPGDVHTVARAGDDVLLVGYNDNQFARPGLLAVRPGDADPLWRRQWNTFGLSADRSLLLVQEESEPGREPNRSVWRAVDPRTGTVRWTVEQPAGGWMTMSTGFYWPGYPSRFFTVYNDGLAEMHDGVTGAVTASGRLPRPPGDGFTAWAGGGLLVAGYGTDETVGYDELTLTERWRRDGVMLPEGGYPAECEPMICLVGFQNGLTVIDPATGREVWRGEGYASPEAIGDRVIIGHASQTVPTLAVLDPRAGRTIAVDGQWLSGGPGPEPGTAWVYRHQAIGYTLRYGILRLSDGKVRILGQAERIAGDCQFTAYALVCRRLDSSIVIWRL